MTGLSDILKMLPIDDIAKQFGVDPAVASQAVEEGSATILSGLAKNAQTSEGASAIEKALGKHSGQSETVDVTSVDAVDGGKILTHIFGDKKETVEKELTKSDKTAGIDFGKLLPMLAPIIMGMLSKNKSQPAGDSAGGGIMDVIGGLLGGGGGNASTGGIGDLLSGVLGGGDADGDGKKDGGPLGGITDLLGGLFGGKK